MDTRKLNRFSLSYVNDLLDKEKRKQEAIEYGEYIIKEYARHHRDPDAYNQEFLDRYNRFEQNRCLSYQVVPSIT